MKRNVLVFSMLLAVLMFAGCNITGTKKETAIGLTTAKSVLVAAGTSAKQLCESDEISAGDCEKIKSLYAEGRTLLIQAKGIWDDMADSDSFASNGNYENIMLRVAAITATIQDIVRRNLK